MPGMRARNFALLAASLLFYAWGEPVNILLLLASVTFNFVAARLIGWCAGRRRTLLLMAAISANVGTLFYFKYAEFVGENLAILQNLIGFMIEVPRADLPLGISFFSFHAISYLIDVYRRRFPANKNMTQVALYMTLFPQLIAGPIVRYGTVAKQLERRRHTIGRAACGARIIILGLAQKVLIADVIAPLPAAVFDHQASPGFGDAWVGLAGYTLQIYFDFAGYSNMAAGLGLVFGFSLPRNFRLPYSSLSVTEFWRRWHMSLSGWLRDYLYIPLGGSRGSPMRTYRNLVIVFLLCGLWHGASWNFVLWGAWHGAFLVFERMLRGSRVRLPGVVRWLYTLGAVTFGWVMFRCQDLPAAAHFYGVLLGGRGVAMPGFDLRVELQATTVLAFAAGGALAVLPRWLPWPRRGGWPAQIAGSALTLVLLLLSILQVAGASFSPFLYFRF